ncbi:DUF2958 domain-containing protein [Anatilimnocola floriformis]|uniref:DUF2958 domain-containing protein n=1 Tax=Anatilimnocola floriformis TaxID=2948575 RepID=UPI0020C49104|nr:DUF2958 domain-containing protein [Anatilimnocola floriformis]
MPKKQTPKSSQFRARNGKGMELLTTELLKVLPLPDAVANPNDPMVFAKLFLAIGSWTMWVTSYDPKSRLLFGVVDHIEVEYGPVPIDELLKFTDFDGSLGFERSTSFSARPLTQCIKRSKAS